MEAVNTLRVSSAVARERLKKREAEMVKQGLLVAPTQSSGAGAPNTPPSRAGTPGKGQVVSVEEEDLRVRLDAMGAHIGANLAERFICSQPCSSLFFIKFDSLL